VLYRGSRPLLFAFGGETSDTMQTVFLNEQLLEAKGTEHYVALRLTNSPALIRWWKANVGELLPEVDAHHVTLQYRPSKSQIQRYPLGKKMAVKVTGVIDTPDVQAVVVDPRNLRIGTKKPHITVALSKGTKPRKSLDAWPMRKKVNNGPIVRGVVVVIDEDGTENGG
jgi:hypothetical protein